MPDGVGEIAESISSAASAAESAAEGVGQAASGLAEVGASDAANSLAESVGAIAEVQGPEAALENLAGDAPFSVEGAVVEGNSDVVGVEGSGESIVDSAQPSEAVEGGNATQPEGSESQMESSDGSQNEVDEETQGEEGVEGADGQDETREGDVDSEREALTVENDALMKENAELKAQLEAYENIRQIIENLDTDSLKENSGQTEEQRKKSLGLILAALQLMLAFFNQVSNENSAKKKKKNINNGLTFPKTNPEPNNPHPDRPGGRESIPSGRPDNVVDFKPRASAPIPISIGKAA